MLDHKAFTPKPDHVAKAIRPNAQGLKCALPLDPKPGQIGTGDCSERPSDRQPARRLDNRPPAGPWTPRCDLDDDCPSFREDGRCSRTAIEAAMRTGPGRQSVLIARFGANSGFL